MDRVFVGSMATMIAAGCCALGYVEFAYDPPAVEAWDIDEEVRLLRPEPSIYFDFRLYYETHELLISPAHAIGVATKFLSSSEHYLVDHSQQHSVFFPVTIEVLQVTFSAVLSPGD